MTVSVGNQTIKATPGTLVVVPRNTVHSFVIDSDQVRALTLLTPAGMEGWFKEFSVPAPTMTLPPAEAFVHPDTKDASSGPEVRNRICLAKEIR